jgi:hypothetical protein
MTLHRLEGFAHLFGPHVENQEAAGQRRFGPASQLSRRMGVNSWRVRSGYMAGGIWLVGGDVGPQQDYEAGTEGSATSRVWSPIIGACPSCWRRWRRSLWARYREPAVLA